MLTCYVCLCNSFLSGVSRMQTSLRRRHRDRVVRRGIGMTIESDFYSTEVNSAHKFTQLLARVTVLVKLTD